MKAKYFYFIMLAVVMGIPAEARLPAHLESEPIPGFVSPQVETKVLKNGLTLYLMRDTSLPLLRLHAIVGYGSLADPPRKKGLATVLMSSLRLGGTQRRTPEEVDTFLDSRSAILATGSKEETAFVELRGLTEDTPDLLQLFIEVMGHPRHDPRLLKTIKGQVAEEVRRRADDPFAVATLSFQQLLYGADSPWAALPTVASVKRVGPKDLAAFHRRYFTPANTRLLVWGNFNPRTIVANLEKLTATWEGGAPVPFPYPPPLAAKAFNPGIFLVPRKIPQPVILFGHLGERRFSPDKYRLLIGNWILGGGGGGTSRLGRKIREEQGYAYMVGSRFTFETEYGQCFVYLQTSEARAAEALQESLALFRSFVRDGAPGGTELKEAKQAFVASLLFEAESTYGFALKTMQFDFFGYPPRYLEVFRNEVLKVTAGGVQEAAARQMFPDQLTILVVGDPKKLEGPLKALGLVRVLHPVGID